MTFLIERDDVDALLNVVNTAVEGFSMGQLLEVQHYLRGIFNHHECQAQRRNAHDPVNAMVSSSGVQNPLLPDSYSAGLTIGTNSSVRAIDNPLLAHMSPVVIPTSTTLERTYSTAYVDTAPVVVDPTAPEEGTSEELLLTLLQTFEQYYNQHPGPSSPL